ncbi:MAG: hybrid sensor histidine kinase/response regulator [Candidatus Omnitrophica bacterium]|nr:hybrid sensor histidine kinase/response regulator [Candidatus Omnitrophota bacterium]
MEDLKTSRKTIRVLYIENDAVDAEWVKRALAEDKKARFQLEVTERISEGLERLAKGGIDVILLDLKLSDGFGIEVFDKVHAAAPEIPKVLYSGTIEEEAIALEALEKGAEDYLQKGTITGRELTRSLLYAIERKQAKEKIQEAAQIKSNFTSMVSYELRTPLTIIKESIGILNDEVSGPINPEQKNFLKIAVMNIDRLARLVNDVLDFQKLDSSQMTMHLTQNDINKLVNEVREHFMPEAQNKGFEFSVELEDGLPLIFLDTDKIVQVLTNLIGNALKFMKNGKVTLKTRRFAENAIQVSVEDQGIGIKSEDIPKLFKPFSQLAKDNERKSGTTGLGLAISKKLLKNIKGKSAWNLCMAKGRHSISSYPSQSAEISKEG